MRSRGKRHGGPWARMRSRIGIFLRYTTTIELVTRYIVKSEQGKKSEQHNNDQGIYSTSVDTFGIPIYW